jgi:predicted house-cleaning noncanonical NTP pyrophosphatase (MazG superfamily)
MPVYHKLVRDCIPEVIAKDGKKCSTRVLNEEEYRAELRKKMSEELLEYKEAKSNEEAMEELADLLELIYAATTIHGADVQQLEAIRKKKADKRGGFDDRIFLIEVEDE